VNVSLVIDKLRAMSDPSLTGAQLFVSEYQKDTEDLDYLHLVSNSPGEEEAEEVALLLIPNGT
jgi:hypothetical protein